jgi:hypothetical protein
MMKSSQKKVHILKHPKVVVDHIKIDHAYKTMIHSKGYIYVTDEKNGGVFVFDAIKFKQIH